MSTGNLAEGFLALSAELTGFSVFDLRGTGESDAYLDAVTGVVGEELVAGLIEAHGQLETAGDRQGEIRRSILGDPRFGPVARNIIKMWFSGVWYALPQAWVAEHGTQRENTVFAIRPSAYAEGLVWKTIGEPIVNTASRYSGRILPVPGRRVTAPGPSLPGYRTRRADSPCWTCAIYDGQFKRADIHYPTPIRTQPWLIRSFLQAPSSSA